VALLDLPPEYVLTDGFPVDGLGVPGLAVWKGDRVAACISAASVIAKVTRDRIMVDLDREHPAYDFSFKATPLTSSRPWSSQQWITSPDTPMTRFTRCPPEGYSPILAISLVTVFGGPTASEPLSQPPGSLKTTTSPRSGLPPNQ
jgi:hypothetical protein